MTTNIEEEWMRFLSHSSGKGTTEKGTTEKGTGEKGMAGRESTLRESTLRESTGRESVAGTPSYSIDPLIPEEISDELYISTKTKVLYLNQTIDIADVFWKIPVLDYGMPKEGVIQKQMKVVSNTEEEYLEYCRHLEGVSYYKEHVIKQINNPSARRIKFKDERKITIGINKKDIMNCRGKVKNAFYNCFAVYIRFRYLGNFKEIHVKIFNTGKLEIPGILNVELLETVKGLILTYIGPYITSTIVESLTFNDSDKDMGVLINSNFNCGYYIHRERLYAILRSEKYGIEAAYEPCSYPGVKCKYYFNNEIGFNVEEQTGCINKMDRSMKLSELNDTKKYTEVSFMIFRTGSCLIVGNCSDRVLLFIYEFIKHLLSVEKENIVVTNEVPVMKNKKAKLRKKTVVMTDGYFSEAMGASK
jgi:hypothetical protein